MTLHIVFNDDCTYFGEDWGELAINYASDKTKQATFDPKHVVAIYENNTRKFGKEAANPIMPGSLEVILGSKAKLSAIHADKLHINPDTDRSWTYNAFDARSGYLKKEIKAVYEGNTLVFPKRTSELKETVKEAM